MLDVGYQLRHDYGQSGALGIGVCNVDACMRNALLLVVLVFSLRCSVWGCSIIGVPAVCPLRHKALYETTKQRLLTSPEGNMQLLTKVAWL